MAVTTCYLVLPVDFIDLDTGTTLQTRSIVVLPGQTFSDVVKVLSKMAGTSDDNVTVFIECDTKERVRMVAQSDLPHQRAVRLHVYVGLPRGVCRVCEKTLNYGLVKEFHLCAEDEIILGENYFRSPAGPIQRPTHDAATV